jgi:hypothetical protein
MPGMACGKSKWGILDKRLSTCWASYSSSFFSQQCAGHNGKYACLELFKAQGAGDGEIGGPAEAETGDRLPLPRVSPSGIVNLTQEATRLVAWQDESTFIISLIEDRLEENRLSHAANLETVFGGWAATA